MSSNGDICMFLPRRNRLHPRRSLPRCCSPTPPGTGVGGLRLQFGARRLRRRSRSRTPLHSSAEERAPRTPPPGCTPASVPDSQEWSRGRRQRSLKKKGKKEEKKSSRWSWNRRRRKSPWLLVSEGWGFLYYLALEEDEFAVKRVDSGWD